MSLSFDTLRKDYDYFRHPVMEVEINGNRFSEQKKMRVMISDVQVDLTAGYEASQASFVLYNVWDMSSTSFDFKTVKKMILLGSPVTLYLGYNSSVISVFAGVITKVNFFFEKEDIPAIRVTAMDAKAVMMANNYSKQLTANAYSDAVKEIFDQSVYSSLQSDGVITELSISGTPDASPTGSVPGTGGATPGSTGANATDKSIEMVAESDYEFVVKVAKKYNYDFFISAGQVVFRSAKSDTSSLITINNTFPIQELDVEYDIRSQVGEVEVRSVDAGKAKVLSGKARNKNKISNGSKAKPLITGSTYVYVDPSVTSTEEAQYRARYIQEDRTYRFVTLKLTMVGLPDLMVGRFFDLNGYGTGVDNTYYIYGLRHTMNTEGHFETTIIGRAATIKTDYTNMIGG